MTRRAAINEALVGNPTGLRGACLATRRFNRRWGACRVVAAAVALSLLLAPVAGDEIIIDSRLSSPVELGGVSWGPKVGLSGSFLELSAVAEPVAGLQTLELTAGELWKFYKAQGMDSVDQLVVVLSVPNTTRGDHLIVEGMQLKIANGNESHDESIMLADAGREHRVIIPGGQSLTGRAEAKMMIPLGFDFMQAYSAESTDKLVLNYKIDGISVSEPPIFMVEGTQNWSRLPTLAMVGLFIGFWLVLFWVLKVVTFVHPKKSGAKLLAISNDGTAAADDAIAKTGTAAREQLLRPAIDDPNPTSTESFARSLS